MKAKNYSGKELIILNAYAKALEIIPKTLCENSGMDSVDILNCLRMKHYQEERLGRWVGVDIENNT